MRERERSGDPDGFRADAPGFEGSRLPCQARDEQFAQNRFKDFGSKHMLCVEEARDGHRPFEIEHARHTIQACGRAKRAWR